MSRGLVALQVVYVRCCGVMKGVMRSRPRQVNIFQHTAMRKHLLKREQDATSLTHSSHSFGVDVWKPEGGACSKIRASRVCPYCTGAPPHQGYAACRFLFAFPLGSRRIGFGSWYEFSDHRFTFFYHVGGALSYILRCKMSDLIFLVSLLPSSVGRQQQLGASPVGGLIQTGEKV